MDAFIGRECLPEFDRYVGQAYETSALDILWFYPTSGGWSSGDRTFQCAVYDPSDDALTGSVRGSGR
jgi:hypothetical protein